MIQHHSVTSHQSGAFEVLLGDAGTSSEVSESHLIHGVVNKVIETMQHHEEYDDEITRCRCGTYITDR